MATYVKVPSSMVFSGQLNDINLEIWSGDLLEMDVESIVIPNDPNLSNRRKLSSLILEAAGSEYESELRTYGSIHCPLDDGQLVPVSGRKINLKGILNVVDSAKKSDFYGKDLIVTSIVNSMIFCYTHDISSVAISVISASNRNLGYEDIAESHIEAYIIYAGQIVPNLNHITLNKIIFVLFEPEWLELFVKSIIKKIEIFDVFNYFGIMKERALGINNSLCTACGQAYDLSYFSVSFAGCSKCHGKFCDFCFYENMPNSFSCNDYKCCNRQKSFKDKTQKKCRKCFKITYSCRCPNTR